MSILSKEIDMFTYTVTVFKESPNNWAQAQGSFVFTGVKANNRNEACRKGIEGYQAFDDQALVKDLCVTASLEK